MPMLQFKCVPTKKRAPTLTVTGSVDLSRCSESIEKMVDQYTVGRDGV